MKRLLNRFTMFFRITILITIFIAKTTCFRFPPSSVCGVLVAIAVPLDLPQYNVFMAYNFETNYNLPTQASDITKGPLILRVKRHKNDTTPEPFFTRRKLYDWIELKLNV